MRKIIAAINMTLNGFCDHTLGIADDEIHQHYTELLSNADVVLYGRITYQLMQYWRTVVKNPTGKKAMDDFAIVMNGIPKIVFSHTLKNVEWESAALAKYDIKEEVLDLKQQPGRDILAGSRSIIIELMKLNLIDEFQLCIHPVVAEGRLPLFDKIHDRTIFKLIKTKAFASGAIILYYEPAKDKTN